MDRWSNWNGWNHIGAWTRSQDPAGVVLVAGLVALVLVADHRVWRISRNAVTIAHEGGHALIALLTGRRLIGIRLHSDTSGVTVSTGRSHGPGMVATTAAGYVTPSLLGLAGAALLTAGEVTAVLVGSLVLLAAMVPAIRNLYGALSVGVTASLVAAAALLAPIGIQAGFAYLETWFLLLGGTRPVFELARRRRQGRASWSDADQLARLTGVPGGLWVTLFAAVALGSLTVTVAILVPRIS